MAYGREVFKMWKDYIEFRLKYKKVDLPKEVEDMLRNLQITYLDADTFMSDKGLMHVYIMDYNYNNERFKVTKTESEEYCMDRWGRLGDKMEDCFNYLLRERFNLDTEQELWVLDTVRKFYDLI